MIVDELIVALQALPPELRQLEVQTEGCDCWGDVGGVQVEVDVDGQPAWILVARPSESST